ncbi:MAG: glutamate racemase [Rikenellaceae bacterium]
MNSSPIGIYDSGFGGLTLWRAVRELLPHESLIYLGDGANCPYGSRRRSEIEALADRAVGELLAHGCKIVVVACNTATAAAIDFLRAKYVGVDIVGMEPAVKPACELTRSGVVGVLATERSLEGDLFHRTAAKYSSNVRVVARFGRGFVELVEGDLEDSAEAERVVRAVVEPMVEEGVDQIVLGCTHYPFLIPVLERVAPGVNIIDPSMAVARRVESLLSSRGALAAVHNSAYYRFETFADEEYRQRLAAKAQSISRKK